MLRLVGKQPLSNFKIEQFESGGRCRIHAVTPRGSGSENQSDTVCFGQRCLKRARPITRFHSADYGAPLGIIQPGDHLVNAWRDFLHRMSGGIPAIEGVSAPRAPIVAAALKEQRDSAGPVGIFLRHEPRSLPRIHAIANPDQSGVPQRPGIERHIVHVAVGLGGIREVESPAALCRVSTAKRTCRRQS